MFSPVITAVFQLESEPKQNKIKILSGVSFRPGSQANRLAMSMILAICVDLLDKVFLTTYIKNFNSKL